MTTLLLVRHAAHDRPGPHLVGRDDTVALAPEGRADAEALAEALAHVPLAAIATSPSRRCRETAERLAAKHGLAPRVVADLDELDFGRWRGATFAALDGDPDWLHFNTARGTAAIPEGETIAAVADRASRALARLSREGPLAVAVTHADVIRTAVAAAIGLSPDLMLRFEIAPASVTAIAWETPPRLLSLNWRPAPPG